MTMPIRSEQNTEPPSLLEQSGNSVAARAAEPRQNLRSMTGFAQNIVQDSGITLTVSVRSVNHRTLDLHLNLPDSLSRFEPGVRREVSKLHPRGHLQIRVGLERAPELAPSVNEALIGQYIELFRRAGERHGLSLETSIVALSQLPGVVEFPSGPSRPEVSHKFEDVLLITVRNTLQQWNAMRETEGSVLEEDLRARTLVISGHTARLETLREESLPLAQKKLRERLQLLLGQNSLDASRLAQEAAMLAERTDVSEEVLRLKAHLVQFLGMLDGKPDAGKKLDFLLQEIQRELNTLLAKTTGLGECGLPMTQLALEMKGEVEKLREQVQNVE